MKKSPPLSLVAAAAIITILLVSAAVTGGCRTKTKYVPVPTRTYLPPGSR